MIEWHFGGFVQDKPPGSDPLRFEHAIPCGQYTLSGPCPVYLISVCLLVGSCWLPLAAFFLLHLFLLRFISLHLSSSHVLSTPPFLVAGVAWVTLDNTNCIALLPSLSPHLIHIPDHIIFHYRPLGRTDGPPFSKIIPFFHLSFFLSFSFLNHPFSFLPNSLHLLSIIQHVFYNSTS